MERILKQTHNKSTILYSCSRMFERAAFYGFRSIIVLYMVGETLMMPQKEALMIYGWFSASFLISHIIGAIIGDFFIGNKRSIIIGGLLQAVGAFLFGIPSSIGLYIGLILIIIGGGIYTPNMISQFGRLYLNKIKLADSGFTIFYTSVNVGSVVGVFVISYIGQVIGWKYGFMAAGLFMIISVIFVFISKESDDFEWEEKEVPLRERTLKIIVGFVAVGLFWAAYEISQIGIFDVQSKISDAVINIPKSLLTSLNSAFILPLGIIAAVVWSYFYSSQFQKLMLGSIFGVFSVVLLFLIPEMPSEQHVIIYLLSILSLSISEVCVAPAVHSILTQYTNPKYLATLISLAVIPTRVFSYAIIYFNDGIYEDSSLALTVALVPMTAMGLGLLIFLKRSKNY